MTDFRGGSKCLECGNRIGSRYDHADWCSDHPDQRRLVPDGGRGESPTRSRFESAEDLPEECQEYNCSEKPQTIVEVDIADAEPERFALCVLCACDVIRRDTAGKVEVIGL